MRKKIVAGNWKMNKSHKEGLELCSEVKNMVKDEVNNQVEVVLIPPYIHLNSLQQLCSGTAVKVGAQDCSAHESGAFTGEVSAAMLASLPIQYVLIGHSERREYHDESGNKLQEKLKSALAHNLTPIFCCGEKLEERENGKVSETIASQLAEVFEGMNAEEISSVVVAYEPVWAIGTGKTASPEQAQEVHALIRSWWKNQFNAATAENLSILYGGSVKPENAQELFAQADIDGGLIGGAALKARSFVDIAKSF